MDYRQTSAQRVPDKNVNVFVGGMCITQRKIVSNTFKCNLIITILLNIFLIIIINYNVVIS